MQKVVSILETIISKQIDAIDINVTNFNEKKGSNSFIKDKSDSKSSTNIMESDINKLDIVNYDYETNKINIFEFCKVAAEKGDNKAQNVLGKLYENGEEIERDLDKAVYWYNIAAKDGYEEAQYNLAKCYQNGIGVKKDDVKAFEFYKIASEKGYILAQISLGELYENGKGIEKNSEKAVYWYNKAAEDGNVEAQHNLCRCYRNGIGVKKDEIKAFELCKVAVEKGYNLTQICLGELYESGEGTEINSEKAQKKGMILLKIVLDYYMKMKKRILKELFIGLIKQQKIIIKWHNII